MLEPDQVCEARDENRCFSGTGTGIHQQVAIERMSYGAPLVRLLRFDCVALEELVYRLGLQLLAFFLDELAGVGVIDLTELLGKERLHSSGLVCLK